MVAGQSTGQLGSRFLAWSGWQHFGSRKGDPGLGVRRALDGFGASAPCLILRQPCVQKCLNYCKISVVVTMLAFLSFVFATQTRLCSSPSVTAGDPRGGDNGDGAGWKKSRSEAGSRGMKWAEKAGRRFGWFASAKLQHRKTGRFFGVELSASSKP